MPAIVGGTEVPGVAGAKIQRLTIFASTAAGFEPIPFQIDEKDASGRFVFRGGGSLGSDDGVLDDNDEIVFMLKDTGAQLAKDYWPPQAKRGVEIELTDPLDTGRRGYVYLLEWDGAPPPAAEDYVRYDPKAYRITTPHAVLGLDPDHPISHTEYRFLDRNGKPGPNLMDKVKVRPSAWTLGDLVRIDVNEEEMDSKITAWTDGAVRVMYEMETTFKLGPIPLVKASTAWLYYERNYVVPVKVQVPGLLRTFTSKIEAEINLDLRDMRGATLSSGAIPQGVTIRGNESSGDDHRKDLGRGGWMLIGQGGDSIFMEISLDKDLPISLSLVYWDTTDGKRGPEYVPGQLPEAGFRIHNWTELDRSVYEFDVNVFPLNDVPDQGGNGLFKSLHTPPAVKTGSGSSPVVLLAGTGIAPAIQSGIEALGTKTERIDVSGLAKRLNAGDVSLIVLERDLDRAYERMLERFGIPVLTLEGRGRGSLWASTSGLVAPDRYGRVLSAVFPKDSHLIFITSAGKEARQRAESYVAPLVAAGLKTEIVQSGSADEIVGVLKGKRPAALVVGGDRFWDTREGAQQIIKVLPAVPLIGMNRETVAGGAAFGVTAEALDPVQLGSQLLRRQKPGSDGGGFKVFVNVEAIRRTRLSLPASVLQISERI